MGYLNLKPEQTNIFFKLMEERYRRRPTILTTNLDYDDWHGFLGNKKMVDALLDRLRHQCFTITINGPSLRSPSPSTPPAEKSRPVKKNTKKKKRK
jgi:DNA replication protein DnaC